MNKSIVFLLICTWFSVKLYSQHIIAGTFNLRYDNPADSGNLWKDRAPVAASLLRFHEFDIIGTQEGLSHQLRDLQSALPEFAWYGLGRDDGGEKGEHSAIFFRKERFNMMDNGDFWLSEHPQKPGFGWDATINRICSWVKLEDKKTKRQFYVFNTHFDHRGIQARRESSKLLLRKIQEIAGRFPVILTGDFNGNHQSEWYNYINDSKLLKDALLQADNPYKNNGSFNSFQTNNHSDEIIDHIFLSADFKVRRYGILTDTFHGRFPSDHFPVLAELVW